MNTLMRSLRSGGQSGTQQSLSSRFRFPDDLGWTKVVGIAVRIAMKQPNLLAESQMIIFFGVPWYRPCLSLVGLHDLVSFH